MNRRRDVWGEARNSNICGGQSPWFGLLAPAGTPKDVIAKISADCAKVLAMPDVQAKLRAQGAEPEGNTHEQFASYLASEIEKWAKVVKATGARID